MSQLKKHIRPKVTQVNLPLFDSEGNIKVHPEIRLIPHNNELVVQWLFKWINLREDATT
jgi:hypothetical protein